MLSRLNRCLKEERTKSRWRRENDDIVKIHDPPVDGEADKLSIRSDLDLLR
ncbi:MAG: hypothetical protein P1U81_06840 [Verrucomicrobiales bacterium]|nr:hypothetical protein [Verrucomicrobiales bacterium]